MALTPSQWSHYVTIPESYIPASSTTGQTLVITEATIGKLSAGDQTIFWSNVLNGGGDVRICTDAGGVNQLPVEIVSLDNVAETCVIWTRKATYSGTGDLFLFIGKVGETQPLPGAAFGSEAVWVDYNLVTHDGLTDSTGNNTLTASNTTTTTGKFSDGLSFNGTSSRVDSLITTSGSVATLQAWVKLDSGRAGSEAYLSIADKDVSNQQLRSQIVTGGTLTRNETSVFDGSVSNITSPVLSNSTTEHQMVHNRYQSGNLVAFANGNPSAIVTSTYTVSGIDRLTIGTTADSTPFGFFSGDVCEAWYTENIKTFNEIETEYENQANQATFFGTPTITATGGGGGVTAGSSFSFQALTVASSVTASLPQPTANSAFSFEALDISGTADATQPNPITNVLFDLSALTIGGSVDVTQPNPTANTSFELQPLTISATADSTQPNPTSAAIFTLPALTVNGTVDASLPNPTANASFNFEALTIAGSASATEPGLITNVNFALNALEFSATGSATLPQPIASSAFTLQGLNINGNITLSGLIIRPSQDAIIFANVGDDSYIVNTQTNILYLN